MRPLLIAVPSLPVQLAFYAFALTLPTAAIKCFSLLSGIALPAGFYVIGAVISVIVFWLFFMLMWGVMSWTGEAPGAPETD